MYLGMARFGNSALRRQLTSNKHLDAEMAGRSQTLSKAEKKKSFNTSTMKPMSAHDEKTLNTAVALANEITTKSMTDLDCDQKIPRSPSDKSKFHFKFPLVSLHHNPGHEMNAAEKQERRNFSEEAKSVPDIQSTITEESKHAYTSLIEDPTPSTSLITHMELVHKPSTIPKPAPRFKESQANFLSLQKQLSYTNQPVTETEDQEILTDDIKNELPLPPRNTKPKLVDKPRHIRKYPLKLPNNATDTNKNNSNDQSEQFIIYQNAVTCSMKDRREHKLDDQNVQKDGVDVFDGPETVKVDTNPFTNNSGPSSANPFNCYLQTIGRGNESEGTKDGKQYFEEGSLVKDHVSVEDLLEFADQKPCGRQRGAESDEVRIMNKVLKQQATLEECLEALELSEWNVHHAIKVIRVKISVGGEVSVSLDDCSRELINSAGDIVKASALLVLYKNNDL